MDNLDFSEEEIQEQLEILGYKNIPKHRLHEFKQDLDELIRHGKWKSLTSSHHVNSTKSQTDAFQPSPPAFTKEKVSRCNADAFEGFFLHAGKVDHDRQVLTTSQDKDNGWRKDHCDSYAQHSVALRLRLPSGAPNALQVESDPEDTLHPPHPDSCASTPDTLERRFIKRKVLRKHKGRSLVCDESVYSEDSALRIHRPHTSARVQVATMYKMYNSQWDQDSDDDDKNSLNSSFWSDGERQEDEKEEEEEEEVEVERVIEEENSKPAAQVEDSLLEASEEEKPELNHQGDDTTESSEDGEEGSDADEGCSSSGDSPVPSLMTSGYGTYRPEEQEGGDYRDDHTITEFDQDSRGDLSEMRDDEEDDRSLSSFGGFDIEPTHELDYGETRPSSVFEDGEASVLCCGDDGPREETDITHMKPEEVESQEDELKFENELPDDLDAESDNEDVKCERSERQQHGVSVAEDEFFQDGKKAEGLTDLEEGEEYERLEADVQDLNVESNVERDVEDKVESEDPDESSSNKDIKFIDSKVDSSWKTYVEWEGNLRHKKDAASCLEERLAELQLSARQDSETENQDVTGQSDTRDSESEEISMSAFESYIRGMTQTHSDGDLRPKPKSFIRPVMNQQTIKKTDPVAKYFQYKQLWEMFKLPGEKDRRALRSEIKERLAYQPPPPKPRRVYVRNTYTVPTEKKRSALRWEIRNDLANGLLPYKYSYRF